MSRKKILSSFKYAFEGIFSLFWRERNAKIQLAVFLLVILAGVYFRIKSVEWIIIFLFSALVLGLEGMNTAIEGLSDCISPDYDKRIKRIKDIAAGAVLMAVIFAVIAGALIFLPYLKCLL